MKLKILAVPVLIVLIIMISIWVIQPTYSSVMETKLIYLQSVEKVNDVSDKLEKAEKLSEELAKLSTEKAVLSEYLPEKNEEERIINYLNDLALREGMSIVNLSLSQRMSQPIAPAVDEFGNAITEIDTTPTVKYVDASFSVSGNYNKVKNFLKKLDKLKRYNGIETISIAKGSSTAEANANSDDLKATMVSNFGYLEKMTSVTKVHSQTLSSDKFNLAVTDKITESKNTDSATLQIDSAGKENPFLR